jgi:SPP1 gp7 family putative phage head morphogenesis protein
MSIEKKLEQATKLTERAEKDFIKAITGQYTTALIAMREDIAKASNYKDFDPVEMQKYNRLNNLIDRVEAELTLLDEMKTANVKDYLATIYEQNYYYTGFALETEGQVKLSYSLLNRKAVVENILTPLDKLAIENNSSMVKQAIKVTLTQAVIQGLSIPDIAERIKKNLETNANNAVRIARTETTRVMSGARLDSMEHAQNKGLPLEKVWVATLDDRTRDRHAEIDGEQQPLDKPFSNGLMYPGDPSGDADQVIQCRCTMVTQIIGLDSIKDQRRIDGNIVPYQTYKEWDKNRLRDSK